MAETEHDNIDGCDLPAAATDIETSDDQIAALALYADINFTNPAAVEVRRQEWETLADV